MAKWRITGRSNSIRKTFDESLSNPDMDVTVEKPARSISLYELWLQYQDAFRKGSCVSIDYPGGIDKLREDAMRERGIIVSDGV